MVPVDIAYDPIPEYKYKEEEDLTKFKSKKTGRGPLQEGWKVRTLLFKNKWLYILAQEITQTE